MSSGVFARYDIVNLRLISSVRIRRKLYREMPNLFRHIQLTEAALPIPDEPAWQVGTDNHQALLALLTAGPMVFSDLLTNFDGTIECLAAALAHLELSGQIEHLGMLYQLRVS